MLDVPSGKQAILLNILFYIISFLVCRGLICRSNAVTGYIIALLKVWRRVYSLRLQLNPQCLQILNSYPVAAITTIFRIIPILNYFVLFGENVFFLRRNIYFLQDLRESDKCVDE